MDSHDLANVYRLYIYIIVYNADLHAKNGIDFLIDKLSNTDYAITIDDSTSAQSWTLTE